jgi:hypothetical protein
MPAICFHGISGRRSFVRAGKPLDSLGDDFEFRMTASWRIRSAMNASRPDVYASMSLIASLM